MKSIPVLMLILLVTGVPTRAQETKAAKIDRVLALMKADALTDEVFQQVKAMTASLAPPDATEKQRAHAQEIQAKIMDLVKDRMSWEKMRPQYVKMYGETFSDEEIDGMLAFYESPAGRAMLEKMPQLVSKMMAMVQSQMTAIMPDVERLARDLAKEPAKK
jgi:hypothetical protein